MFVCNYVHVLCLGRQVNDVSHEESKVDADRQRSRRSKRDDDKGKSSRKHKDKDRDRDRDQDDKEKARGKEKKRDKDGDDGKERKSKSSRRDRDKDRDKDRDADTPAGSGTNTPAGTRAGVAGRSAAPAATAAEGAGGDSTHGATAVAFEPTKFFEDQLTAFDVWLRFGAYHRDCSKPPQLPVVLQVLEAARKPVVRQVVDAVQLTVPGFPLASPPGDLQGLLSQDRLRALVLLARYLDTSPEAVFAAKDVGVFPYLVRLLKVPWFPAISDVV